MVRRCMRCGEVYGEKEPLEDKSETTGLCDECFIVTMDEIEAYQIEKGLKKEQGLRVDLPVPLAAPRQTGD